MTEHAKQAENSSQEPTSASSGAQSERRSSLPVVFSALAMLIAALALAANLLANKPVQNDPMQSINSKLGQIEARIGDVEAQMSNDKLDVVDTQLKQILLSLQQLAHIADDSTRARIERAYKLLEPLTMPATRIKAEVDLPEIDAQKLATAENKNAEALAAAVEKNAESTPNAAVIQEIPSATATEIPQLQPEEQSGGQSEAPAK